MRIAIRFEPEGGCLLLPIHYNHIVQAMIYSSLDSALADWYHNEGYSYGKRRFKLFTFSRLLSEKRFFDRHKKFINLVSPILLKIASMDENLLESLVNHLIRKGKFILNGIECQVQSVEVEPRVKFRGAVVVKALSPILTYSTLYDILRSRKKVYYYSPWEKEFEEQILKNLERKAKAFYGVKRELPSLEGAYIKPLRVSNRNLAVVKFKETWLKGWTGVYELNLPEPYFTLAYDSGLGSKNSQGFGMVEVVKLAKGY